MGASHMTHSRAQIPKGNMPDPLKGTQRGYTSKKASKRETPGCHHKIGVESLGTEVFKDGKELQNLVNSFSNIYTTNTHYEDENKVTSDEISLHQDPTIKIQIKKCFAEKLKCKMLSSRHQLDQPCPAFQEMLNKHWHPVSIKTRQNSLSISS